MLPADTPVTTPLLFIVATPVLEECHTIVPVAVVDRFVVRPTHTEFVPVIAGVAGKAFTVTTVVEVLLQVPLLAVTLYVPAPKAVMPAILGLCKIEVKLLGPLQFQLVADPPVSLRFSIEPAQTGLLLDAVTVGSAFTVTA